jgi:hypothetical protein
MENIKLRSNSDNLSKTNKPEISDHGANQFKPNTTVAAVQYPFPIKMHVSECLSNFNSRRCDEIMVLPL